LSSGATIAKNTVYKVQKAWKDKSKHGKLKRRDGKGRLSAPVNPANRRQPIRLYLSLTGRLGFHSRN
jgi:hypothetical protein